MSENGRPSHRCDCGSRIFLNQTSAIITDIGVVMEAKSWTVLLCVRCSKRYFIDMAAGRKKLELLPSGWDLERRLFVEWVKSSLNDNFPKAPNRDFVTCDPDDKKDFQRLSVHYDEVYSTTKEKGKP